MAGEIGLLGLAAFIWLVFVLFKLIKDTLRKLTDAYLRIILLSLAASLIAFLINGLTETSLYYGRVSMIFWYLAGFAISFKKCVDNAQAP